MFSGTEFLLFLCLVSFDINTFLSFYASSKCSLSFLAPLEAILFDIDGTICDSDPLHYYAFRDMLQEVGFNGGVPSPRNSLLRLLVASTM
ncbi:Haloacid dehalogenase-like hydrolase domain-containing protein Sgpp [Vitis vinifera]|uniref:Haloacid dehalogenase-like hydrolase domain-containing protein Sgpp n=1 Tax=Vitis vinifera TaxID=29760 RepID=A0A438J033_VITVI|nr:Haloacid dehalogenase-like hydrolase domain-containing protein Sgpp [Vitis vinifera]